MAEQARIVRAHRLCGAHPDFLYGLHTGPSVEDDRKRRDEADEQHGGFVAEPEPKEKQRRIGEAGDGRADADQRQENIFGGARAAHRNADRDARKRCEREAGTKADHGIERMMGQDAVQRQPPERRGDDFQRGE